MQRSSIVCKIIEEIALFLMKKGYYDLEIKINQLEHLSEIIFISDRIDDVLLSKIKARLDVERRIEIEEYSWELMGEGLASKQDLSLIGASTDEVFFEQTETKTIMRLIRHE